MSIALDYTSRIDPQALRDAGVTVVCRYLSWLYRYGGQTHTTVNPKIIQQQEYDELRAAGFQVVLNWEYDPHDYRGGAMAGADHSREAISQARALGYPDGSVIIGSADADVTRAEWLGTGRPYYTAFSTNLRISGYRPGIYGPYDVLTWARDDDVAEVYWQAGMSTAWSGGRNAAAWPGAHLRQRGAKTVGGVSGDWNDILNIPWEAGMEQTDPIKGYKSRGNTVGDFMADQVNLRDWLYGQPDVAAANPPPPGSRLDLLLKAYTAGGVDVDALADKVAALLPKPPTAAEVAAELIAQLRAR